MKEPDLHPEGKPFSTSTYVTYKCRCERCTEESNAYQRKRRAKPQTVSTDLWIDWSGITAVCVCRCGWQEFGGFDVESARALAIAHRESEHPDWPRLHIKPTALPCSWGDTEWGVLLGETCEKDAVSAGLCGNHYGRLGVLDERGLCEIPDCLAINRAGEAVCTYHFNRNVKAPVEDPQKPGRKRVVREAIRLPEGVSHGTRNGFKRGCRCVRCGAAQSAYAADARRKRLERGVS